MLLVVVEPQLPVLPPLPVAPPDAEPPLPVAPPDALPPLPVAPPDALPPEPPRPPAPPLAVPPDPPRPPLPAPAAPPLAVPPLPPPPVPPDPIFPPEAVAPPLPPLLDPPAPRLPPVLDPPVPTLPPVLDPPVPTLPPLPPDPGCPPEAVMPPAPVLPAVPDAPPDLLAPPLPPAEPVTPPLWPPDPVDDWPVLEPLEQATSEAPRENNTATFRRWRRRETSYCIVGVLCRKARARNSRVYFVQLRVSPIWFKRDARFLETTTKSGQARPGCDGVAPRPTGGRPWIPRSSIDPARNSFGPIAIGQSRLGLSGGNHTLAATEATCKPQGGPSCAFRS